MYKAKLFGFAVVCAVTLAAMNTDAVLATETNSDTTEQTQTSTSQKEDKITKANQKWNALTDKQKEAVYSLMESDLQTQGKILDKLSELGVIEKEDTELFKSRMTDDYNRVKQSGEFPFMRQRGNKNCK